MGVKGGMLKDDASWAGLDIKEVCLDLWLFNDFKLGADSYASRKCRCTASSCN